MTAIIEVENLTKKYGRFTAVDGVSFSVEEGSVFGFIGPNGAGKTTTMRILTTLLTPTGGEIRVGGHSVTQQPREVRKLIGYMPDFFGVYNDMKLWEYLDFFSSCYEVPPDRRSKLIDDLLILVDLQHRRNDQVESLSRGMKQRLCLARTLAHDPKLLVLDEPASGLDPRARVEIRELLRELQTMGKTIFFSSHILSEVEEICTHIGIIEAGKIVAYGATDAIQEQLQQKRLINIRLVDAGSLEAAKQALSAYMGVLAINDEPPKTATWHVQAEFVGDDDDISRLLATLVSGGIPLLSFWEEKADLEDMFMQLTQGIVS